MQASEPSRDASDVHNHVERRRYQQPKVLKKRSVAKVTLFSGGGATAGGLTATG